MAKKRSQPNHWLTVISIAVIVAALLGIAYLADNTTGSSAQQLYTRNLSATTGNEDSNLPRSPYPACQDLLDKANKSVGGDAEYQAALAALTALVKERDHWNDVLYNDRNATEAEKQNARVQLMLLAPKIRAAQQRLADRKAQLFAEYEACVAKEKAKRKPWWQLFSRSSNQPAPTSNTPNTRTTR